MSLDLFCIIGPCADGTLIDGAFPDFSFDRSLRNWVTDMDMFCVEPIKTSLFGALFFAGVLVSMTILTFTSKFGRKINLVVG